MDLLFGNYLLTINAWAALAVLLLLQVLVVDVSALRAKHVPGTPVEANHDNFLFRATRAVANINETIAIYIVVVLFCVFSGANADYTGYLSWAYVGARAAYACCYYFDLRLWRSVCFGVSLLSLSALLVVGLLA
ncbi:MAG: MAPEG family protein [Proteobacteria bacterium]|nr:MAPEG family protein [Pseudomonadota bacterium]MDA0927197.1 MAPEG family protein [Pseudomonadota bacterium]